MDPFLRYMPEGAYAKGGSITAVVGPAGSGKKTLLYQLISEAGVTWDGAVALGFSPSVDGWERITEFIPESCVYECPDIDAITRIFESLRAIKDSRVLVVFSDRLLHDLPKEDTAKLHLHLCCARQLGVDAFLVAQSAKDILPCIRTCVNYVAVPATNYSSAKRTLEVFSGETYVLGACGKKLKHPAVWCGGWFMHKRSTYGWGPLDHYAFRPLASRGVVSSMLPHGVPHILPEEMWRLHRMFVLDESDAKEGAAKYPIPGLARMVAALASNTLQG